MNLYSSMKRVLFLLLALISLNVMAQEKPIQCDSVIQAEGKNVSVLYPQIRAWAAMTFNSAQDVIQMEDANNGILICKGAFSYRAPGGMTYRCIDGAVNYSLKIQIRDGRYKVTMSGFTHESFDPSWKSTWSFGLITDREKFKPSGLQDKRWLKTWPDLQQKCVAYFNEIVRSLSMATSENNAIIDTEDDW